MQPHMSLALCVCPPTCSHTCPWLSVCVHRHAAIHVHGSLCVSTYIQPHMSMAVCVCVHRHAATHVHGSVCPPTCSHTCPWLCVCPPTCSHTCPWLFVSVHRLVFCGSGRPRRESKASLALCRLYTTHCVRCHHASLRSNFRFNA